MNADFRRTNDEIIELYEKHVDMVYRICFMLLKNKADTEDAVQSIFIKVIERDIRFENSEHEKAWFIITAQNECKNQLKHWWRKNIQIDENYSDKSYEYKRDEVLDNVLALPDTYKLPIYLFYYEGYSTDEIAKVLQLNASTLRSRLKKGRELLKLSIGGMTAETR